MKRPASIRTARTSSNGGLYNELLHQIENPDIFVAWKLHDGNLAAAANDSFVSLEYQPKCRDLAASIGSEEFVIRTDQVRPDRLLDLVSPLIAHLDRRRTVSRREM